MRIGIWLPFVGEDGGLLDGEGIADRARRIEAAGLDGVWMGDRMPLPDDVDRALPDPLMYLMICALATSAAMEVGTCIYCLPLRNKYEVAQRVLTMETVVPGRFTFGVGTGSQEIEYNTNGLDWESRFARMADHMAGIRRLFAEVPTGDRSDHEGAPPALSGPLNRKLETVRSGTWLQQIGRPRFALGAWHSKIQLKIAANEYDGWIASGGPGTQFGGWRRVFSESIKRYRDLGGRRALVSTVAVDLKGTAHQLDEEGAFSLVCPPEIAAERLQILNDMGFDDVILHVTSQSLPDSRKGIARRYDPTPDDLAQIRALLPKDLGDYRARLSTQTSVPWPSRCMLVRLQSAGCFRRASPSGATRRMSAPLSESWSRPRAM